MKMKPNLFVLNMIEGVFVKIIRENFLSETETIYRVISDE